MRLRNPFSTLKKGEYALWICSLVIVGVSLVISGSGDIVSLSAPIVGVTALIFVAKGDVFGQVLTVLFSLLYAVLSLRFRYYGEMITYLCMTMPIAALSVVTWLKNPYSETQVKVSRLKNPERILLTVLTAAVTFAFYFILKAFDTPNLAVSTLSIATSFSAAYLQMRRSPAYAVAYAANDLVLITLWVMASITDISYLSTAVCFLMFFINDIYGFISWSKMKKEQAKNTPLL